MKRETGYYWVKRMRGEKLDWEIAFFHERVWLLFGSIMYCTGNDFAEIDERKIERPKQNEIEK